MTTIEVVIPHRSRWDLLERLLDSLDRQTLPVSVCVVDNASADNSVAQLRRRDIRLIELPENVGFGRAVNAGALTSDAQFILVLNNDMVADPCFAEAMFAELERDEDVFVNALQLQPDGTVDSVGVALDQSLCAYDVGRDLLPEALDRESLKAIGPTGGAVGFRKQTFAQLGGYDTDIFAYLEDVDLAIRMRSAGVQYRLAEEAKIWHHHSTTLGSGSRAKNRLMGWSRGYILWKYGASLRPIDRLRGATIDSVTYLGQILIDRNAGAIEGRISFTRGRRGPRPLAMEIPRNRVSMRAALKRKISRR